MQDDALRGYEQAPIVVEISLDKNGDPVATPEEVNALGGRTVFWSPDSDRPWVVAIDGTDSPFQNGKLVWSGRGEGVHVGGPLKDVDGEKRYKYTLLYQDPKGRWRDRDPIIVVRAPVAPSNDF